VIGGVNAVRYHSTHCRKCSSSLTTAYEYDAFGNPIKITETAGVKLLSKNALNESKTTLSNGRSQTFKVTDNLNGTICGGASGNAIQ
jgi:hypothetical protein